MRRRKVGVERTFIIAITEDSTAVELNNIWDHLLVDEKIML